jgi:hypothetical protein
MRPILFTVIMPSFLMIAGIIMLILGYSNGVFVSFIGVVWLIISFLLIYKDDEPNTLGMGRGRKR